MRVIYNNIIPFKGFIAINLFGVLFVRSEKKGNLLPSTYVHESIHTAQMRDFCKWLPIGGVIFYILYFFEWLFRLITPPFREAYERISFEKEAYAHQDDANYLATRPRFAQWKKQVI